MKFNNKWGYGQLFGFSAVEGPNRYYEDFILMTMRKKLQFRIELFPHYYLIDFPTKEKITFKAIMGDFVTALIGTKEFVFTFLDNDTLIGISPVLPVISGEKGSFRETHSYNVPLYNNGRHSLGYLYEKLDDGTYKFVIHHSFSEAEARSGANRYIKDLDVKAYLNRYIKYYENMPKCKNKKYESLYYKCLSVQKVNIHTAEGKIRRTWTTPDRVPHRHMWMWDTCFHALAMKEYNPSLAEEIFLAMLEQTREDGFMPHMANPTDSSDVTQPCVMSYGAYQIYQVTKNVEFLKTAVLYLDKYLTYDINNRDKNHNGLLEWYTEPDYEICKCGESGLDNSPRFDFDEEMDCMDFSTYLARDSEYLAKIYEILGNFEKKQYWEEVSNKTKKLIHDTLWDEKVHAYCDKLFSGEFTHVLTHSSFLPMLANIADEKQAKEMVEVIKDKTGLWTKMPIASISQQDPRFSNDMWRGGVWLNLNYFIIQGLKNYGYQKEAQELINVTLEAVNKWYKKTGCIFEFFDPQNEIVPYYCHRKGNPLKKPDYRKQVHSITDYNWSACFTMLMIQNKY